MKCFFKKLDNEISYYEFTKDTIYEVNKTHNRIKSSECCGLDNAGDKECTCKGEFTQME